MPPLEPSRADSTPRFWKCPIHALLKYFTGNLKKEALFISSLPVSLKVASGALCNHVRNLPESNPNISSVQSLSRVPLFVTPWIAACQASLSITNSWSSLRLTSIESVMPSSHLILCRPLLLLPPIPPSIRLFQWVNSSHEVAKVLEFQL